MIGRTTVEISHFSRRESTETVLSNSQSPSFAVYRRSSDNKSDGDEDKEEVTELKLRDVKKRKNEASPILLKKSTQPTAKKFREEPLTCSRSKTVSDVGHHVKKNETRRKTIPGLNDDMLEMYMTLRKSASLVPIPHTLLSDDDNDISNSKSKPEMKVCSIDDRKRVLLNVFSRRFRLKVSSETLHLGAALLDKCLDVMSVNTDRLEELVAVTVAIASKIEDVDCLTLGNLLDFDLIKNRPLSMVASLEKFVLTSLSFRVTIPTPFNFASYMLIHVGALESERHLTHYFLELSILYVHNRGFPSDVVAYAAICLSFLMDTVPGRIVSRVLREIELDLRVFIDDNFSTVRNSSQDVMRTMADLFVVARAENHAIFKEYSSPRRSFVALRRISSDLLEMLRIDSS